MAKKQFKTESKKLLDMMINSIYTHKEIFLRELISNASDAIDKQYVMALTDEKLRKEQGEYEIRIAADKDARLLTISDNGCGMSREDLENNLGTIAKSGSFDFKNDPDNKNENIDVIGQFGVGFYAAFMVADDVKVVSKTNGSEESWQWESQGTDGYSITPAARQVVGTDVILHIKDDGEDDDYSQYLNEYTIRGLVKKYSDYIHYPIRMLTSTSKPKEGSDGEYETVTEDSTLNSMVPIWKRSESDVSAEEYGNFYKEKFLDFEDPVKVIRQQTEGIVSYEALLFIPSRAPFDYYSKTYEKGLQLYSSGVMIMDKCADLLPDYFSFVKGVVDSPDLTLNISRETLQHDRQLKVIAKNVESKIASKLSEMLEKERENYEKFFSAFGMQLKWGIYNDYGAHKDVLEKLLLFRSTFENKNVTLAEYVGRMKDGQDKIFYAAGESVEQIDMLPQVSAAKEHGYEVLYLTENIDEFAIQILSVFDGKTFANVCSEETDISSEEEKSALNAENESSKDILAFINDCIDGVGSVRFTNTLKDHPACISNEGMLSANMEKTLNMMPGAENDDIKAQLVFEINMNHPVAARLKGLYADDRERLRDYAKILYNNARLVSGLSVDDPAEFSMLVSKLLSE